ncbi:MAG: hypothetical protein GY755_25535 [Chloroflexi bacterium]|nr:hypothetical protein [Chloroflexota bacterium]
MPTQEKVEELSKILESIIAILAWDDEKHWQETIIKIKQDLDDAKIASAIRRLLGIYGGMGSFNDLVIGQNYKNGEFAWKDGAKEKNAELSTLRTKAYDLAIALR